jgi:cytochrome b561
MMYFLLLVIVLLGFLGLAQSPVKVFELHSITVFVKDELNNCTLSLFRLAISVFWASPRWACGC